MNEKTKERMLDLLTDKVLFGLDTLELAELKELENLFPELAGDNSLELTAGAINLTALESIEPMPAHLRSKIAQDAENFFKTEQVVEENNKKVLNFQPKLREVAAVSEEEFQPARVIEFKPPRRAWGNWLGWAFAAAACLALVVNIWFTRIQKPQEIVEVKPPPQVLTISQLREQLLKESDVVKADWSEANPKVPVGVSGDVVWSNKDQKGYLRLRGLPKNDTTKESYQLWIFDANQDDKTPVDGGVFDINADGEVIIPIDAKIKVGKPQMFAVTSEKSGGVVVSKRDKIVTIAKIQA